MVNKLKSDIKKVKKHYKHSGLLGLIKMLISTFYWRALHGTAKVIRTFSRNRKYIYKKWISENEITVSDAHIIGPLISVLVPVYNVDPKYLKLCVDSVLAQTYNNWELCLYDDCSTSNETISYLKDLVTSFDGRIKIIFGKKNLNISLATNEALKQSNGEYIALLDNDDEIAPNALYEMANSISENPEAVLFYSDEDKITLDGKRFAPFFKPSWSPELLLSMMYTCHLSVYKKSAVEKVGGFRAGYEGAQDYDLALRVTENLSTKDVVHIPKVLYHWRAIPGSTAMGHGEKDYAAIAAKKALGDYLKRNEIDGEVVDGLAPGSYRVKREILGKPSVAIIIPFRDKVALLKRCVSSVIKNTTYDNYQIILVDNCSQMPSTKNFLNVIKKNKRITVINYKKPFNYSAINNYAVKKVVADYVLLLNNDTKVISPEWLSAMLEQAQLNCVGAVGAKLLYPDNRIQHAGVILGTGIAGHAFKFLADGEYGYFSQASVIRDYSAVTAACLLVKKDKYLEIGGLDEKNLTVAYNDVDFCLRLMAKGYRNVYTPYAKLYHYESASRGDDNPENHKHENPEKYNRINSELNFMKQNWSSLIENDPYYSPNLSRVSEDFSLRFREDEI